MWKGVPEADTVASLAPTQIEVEKTKNMGANLERISTDLAAIRAENKALSGK